MAVFTRIRKVANPHRRKVSVKKRRVKLTRNASGQFVRRKKAKRKATAKRKPVRRAKRNPVRRRRAVKAVRRKVVRRKPARKARKRRNPALLVTLGAVNPQPKRKVKVARRKKAKRNPARRRRSRKNATRIVVVAPRRRSVRRRSNPKRRRVSHRRHARRNPSVFGSRLGSGQTLSMVAGVLVGVTAAKVIPGMLLPAQLTASPILRLIATGASAYVASLLSGKVFSGQFSDAVFLGGLAQTGSVALNTFVPSIGARVGLNGGMGDLVPGTFPVPQNPIKGYVPPAPPTTVRTSMNGIARAFNPGFGS